MGQEASQIGTAYAATKEDWIYPSYRTHSIALLRGVPLKSIYDQLWGNATDVVKGRQMPNHFSFRQWNLVSISSPIGTQITQAAGTARAMQIRGDKIATWVYFGDGGTSEGEFHAGLNFAGVWKAPCVFVCENNHWAISVPQHMQTASAIVRREGGRLRHARRARRRQRRPRRLPGGEGGARARDPRRRADADRDGHLPHGPALARATTRSATRRPSSSSRGRRRTRIARFQAYLEGQEALDARRARRS